MTAGGAAAATAEPLRPYQFSCDWLSPHLPFWEALLGETKPTRLLEIGCFEGRATTFLIERCSTFGSVSITCVDTWRGSADLAPERMAGVEQRFDHNVAAARRAASSKITLAKIKDDSSVALPRLIVDGQRFDFIYVDGSHTAPDVLRDAVLAFHLLRVGGLMVFDDYLWCMEAHDWQDALNMPKPAIDAFVNLYARKLKVVSISYQLALVKTAD